MSHVFPFLSKIIYRDSLGLISASWDTSIAITDIEHNTKVRTLGEVDGHVKSVLSMDWNDQGKIIASAGSEREVYIWNPYIVHPVAKFYGHHAPVSAVAFNEEVIALHPILHATFNVLFR